MTARRSVARQGTARPARGPSMDSVDDPLPLDWPRHSYATYIHVGGADRRDHHAPGLTALNDVITITGMGDHLHRNAHSNRLSKGP
jgi:hypothetical protein